MGHESLIAVALAVLLTQSSSPSRVDRVKTLLTAFGVSGPFRLQALSSFQNFGEPSVHVVVTDKRGQAYEAYVRPHGMDLWRGAQFSTSLGFPAKKTFGSAAETTLKKWMDAYKTKQPVGLLRMETDAQGVSFAEFPILRNGHPFVVPNQQYGYEFTCDARGQFARFSAKENPPSVDPHPAVLTRAGAQLKVDRIYQALQAKSKGISYRLMSPSELGYYKPPTELTARLVWRVPVMHITSNSGGSRGHHTAILIDAVTGAQIWAETPQ